MSQVFLSYASADRNRAKRLADAMQRFGYRVWWDRQIAPGRSFDEVIEEALNESACVVVLWSATSVTSQWVKTEASEAASRGILVPARIDDVKPPLEFRRVQAADLTRWAGDTTDPEFRQFLRAVDDEIRAHREALAEAPTMRGTPQAVGMAAGVTGAAYAAAVADPRMVPPLASAPEPPASPGSPAATRWRAALAALAVVALVGASVAWWFLGRDAQVPSVVGMSYEQAVVALTALGAAYPERREQPSSTDTPGSVVAQSLAPGTVLASGATISLTVAVPMPRAEDGSTRGTLPRGDGPPADLPPPAEPLATIPDLRGQTAERAAQLLADAGLTVGATTEAASNDVTLGTVIDQAPAASQTIAQGSPVQLTVATRRTAPELIGRELQVAQDELTKLGLVPRVERIRAVTRDTDGRVVMQAPAGGSEMDAGAELRLTIAVVTPRRFDGGESLFRTGGDRCRQVCKEVGLRWTSEWSGSANTCTCDF